MLPKLSILPKFNYLRFWIKTLLQKSGLLVEARDCNVM